MKRLLAASLALLGFSSTGCYQDDTLHPGAISPTQVLITDDPFPYDSVAAVNIYVSRIEASTGLDTTSAGNWVTIATPNTTFDLLTLQQGATAFVGAGTIDAGRYAAIRMTIDADRSSISYVGGAPAAIRWPYPGSGEIPVYALVERPLAVSATGAVIVIDFDLGRSFLYNTTGLRDFVMVPVLRAVNSAATGTIRGTITGYDIASGTTGPVRNANITVTVEDSLYPTSTSYVAATGRTDDQGRYRISFLVPGTYAVRAEQPDMPWLASLTQPGVAVAAGDTTTFSAALPNAGGGGAYLHITGSDTVYVGGGTELLAAVGDAQGNPITDPQVTWVSRDTLIASLVDSSVSGATYSFRVALGRQEGSTWIVATSGALADSVLMHVVPSPVQNPVASVTVTPATLTLAVGDSSFLQATLRDANGVELTNRSISWFPADSTGVVDLLVSVGPTAVLKAKRTGTTVIRATSEGKTGSATVTVQ